MTHYNTVLRRCGRRRGRNGENNYGTHHHCRHLCGSGGAGRPGGHCLWLGPHHPGYEDLRGIVIGKKGAEIEKLKKELRRFTSSEVLLLIKEVKKPELDATLVADSIAQQLIRRVAFRRAMKKAVLQTLKSGALGIKVMCGGRLAGADIARSEWYIKGRVPLQTLRAAIDYGTAEALTAYGIIGVKVWIFTGEILEDRSGKGAE